MTNNIATVIQGIDDMLAWFKANKPDQYDQQFQDLVQKRLELRTMWETLCDNPGIAAYGESQKGKSYLMSNLLQNNGQPFTVSGPNGQVYNYVSELNPPGEGQEATGVVTRFTSFRQNPERYSKEYPVLMRVHRVHEIVTILCDAYHFDVTDYEQWLGNELDDCSEKLLAKYDNVTVIQDVVVEDDVIAIKNYLTDYVNGAQGIYKSDYLDTLARIIRKVPICDFADVFQPLWHNHPDVTNLFKRLLDVLKRLDFAKEIYLPMDAIEHKQIKPRTIMSVQCLQGIYMSDFKYRTDAYLRKGDEFIRIADFNRAHLSAVCREIVLKVEEKFLNCNMSYDTTMISEDVLGKIPHKEFKRDLLTHADLLDFPGARSREKLFSKNLSNVDTDSGEHNMIKLLLRGKIAYLFNHYNSARALNLLMYCHDTKNVGVTEMYQVIEKWILTYIGADPAARASTIKECNGIPPFFVISTMFNKDMVENNQDVNKNSMPALEQRWINRFNILYKEAFHAGTDVQWFKSWDRPDSKFNNIFVLRDFKYSALGGDGSNLFEGFGPGSPKEKKMVISKEHFANMRESYIKLLRTHDVLKNMVLDPELSWDLAATINNDGSVYIIDCLTTVASRLGILREKQFSEVTGEVRNQLIRILETVYQNPDSKDPIRDTKRTVGMMRLSFDQAVNSDNYFFGNLIESIQTNIREVYKVVQETINDPDVTEDVHGTHDWEIIRKELEECKTREECIETLCRMYGSFDENELRSTLTAIGIDLDDIISNSVSSSRMSSVIAERVLKAWALKLNQASTAQAACGGVLDLTPFGILRDHLFQAAKLNSLDKEIAKKIEDLTDVNNLAIVNQYQVADTISGQINKFVNDWGFCYLEPKEREEMMGYDDKYQFQIFQMIGKQAKKTYTETELTALFTRLTSEPTAMSDSFHINYRRWFAFLTLAFLRQETKLGKIIDNPEENDKIGQILATIKAVE